MTVPQIIIENDNALVQAEGVQRKAETNQLNNAIESLLPSSGILPPAVRWVSSSLHAVIVERPPFVARVGYRPGQAGVYDAENAREYYLPVPWQVYGMVFEEDWTMLNRLYLHVRNSPILDMDSQLLMFPYPNVFNTGSACMGLGFNERYRESNPHNLSSAVNAVLNAFWTADFNEDAGPNTWTAGWRAPVNSMSSEYRDAVLENNIQNQTLLRYYSNIPLEHFVKWQFGLSNSLNPEGDTIADIIKDLSIYDNLAFTNANGLYKSLRMIVNTASQKNEK